MAKSIFRNVAVFLSFVLGFGPGLTCAAPSTRPLESVRRPFGGGTAPAPKSPHSPRRQRDLSRLNGQTTTLLPDGRALVVGGEDADGVPQSVAFIREAQTGEASPLPSGPRQARAWHTATMLPDGRVLVYGGRGAGGRVLGDAELFDPARQSFDPLDAKLAPRAHHTATLMTDGRVLLAGGVSAGGRASAHAELWDARANAVAKLTPGGNVARQKHRATLQPDGNVLLEGGLDADGNALDSAEIFQPESRSFYFTAPPPARAPGETPQLMGSLPADGAKGVPTDAVIALRFSTRLRVETVNAETLRLNGPEGAVAASVVPAEGGGLAFVTPRGKLLEGRTYTLSVAGAADERSVVAPAAVSFETAGGEEESPRPPGPPEKETDWSPDVNNFRGDWSSKLPRSRWQDLAPLQAAPGVTAVSGQALTLNGQPLANVTLRIGGAQARTDKSGRFLLGPVPSGHQVLVIDGHTASEPARAYGIFRAGVEVRDGQTNVLAFTIWMPRLDMRNAKSVASPTQADTVITHPDIPGLELHLPRGTVIRDLDGRAVTQVSITPVPTDRPPFPLPPGFNVPVFFTVQPGGARLIPPRARLIYPNYTHQPPGARVNFWNYDPEGKGWYMYGQGTVSADGRQVVPDQGVVIYEFSGIMISGGNGVPDQGPGPGNDANDGDPVDLSTGLFLLKKTDLSLSDSIPVVLSRTYRQADNNSRAFGVGASHPYEMFLWSNNNYQEADVVLPDGGRVHYTRISPGTGFSDAVYEHTTTPSQFYKSRLSWNGTGWELTLKDGLTYVFGDFAPLQSIRDRYGNRVTVTRAGGGTGNITQLTSPNGRWIQFTYDTSNRVTQAKDNVGRTVGYQYDSSGRLWKVTDVNGGVTEYTYDSAHRMLTVKDPRGIVYLTNEYDTAGRVSKQTLADETPSVSTDNPTFQFAYTTDTSNRVTQTDVTSPRGNVRRVTFNSAGYTLTDTAAHGSSVQQTATYVRQSGSNLVLSKTDQLGRKTSYAYDSMGNVTTMTVMADTTSAASTTFTYEAAYNQVATVTDALNHTTTYAYDSKGSVTSITDPLSHQTGFTYNGAGQVTAITDALSHVTQFVYDGADLAEVHDPLNRTTVRYTDGAGRLLSIRRPGGSTNRYEYNAFGQVTKVYDPLQGTTTFAYDANGNLTSVTDARSNVTTFTYNNGDRLASRTDSLQGSSSAETYEYDKDGNLSKVTDRRGKVSVFTYDALSRRSFAGFGLTTGPTYESTIEYAYDGANRLTEASDSVAGDITRAYDDAARTVTETAALGSVTYTTDAAGRLTGKSVSGQSSISYTYDNANRLTAMTQGTSSVGIAYDNADRRTSLTLPNGLSMHYAYDDASQVTGITYKNGSTTLGDLSYTYDAAGKRVKMGGSYARTSLPAAFNSTTYDAANRLTQKGSATLSYDANGNLTGDGTYAYTWNARNQLASVSATGLSVSYQYDAFGRRAARTVNGTTTSYLYDGANVAREFTGSTATAELLNGGVDEVFTRTDSSGPRNLFRDAVGSTLALTDGSGSVQTQYTYDPFGATSYTGSADANAALFTGREADAAGLYYYRARYYSPALARFISEDPAGFRGGDANLQAYVWNDPVNHADPSGEFGHIVAGAAIGMGFNSALYIAGRVVSGQPVTGRGLANAAISGAITGGLTAAFPLAGFGMANFAGNAILSGAFSAAGQIGANVLTRTNVTDGVLSQALGGAFAGGLFGGLKGFANTPMDPLADRFSDGIYNALGSALGTLGDGLMDLFGRK
jgi:RHS repeat-associated protein